MKYLVVQAQIFARFIEYINLKLTIFLFPPFGFDSSIVS